MAVLLKRCGHQGGKSKRGITLGEVKKGIKPHVKKRRNILCKWGALLNGPTMKNFGGKAKAVRESEGRKQRAVLSNKT